MAYYNICPDCGAHLDPGEPCDCKERREEKSNRSIIHAYRAIGTLEELREAMEKQRTKKPYSEIEKATGLHEDYECCECPNCDSFLGHVSDCKDEHYRYDYCPTCGQAIDWRE